MGIIQFKDIWEMYRIKFIIDSKISWENYWALKGINFEVEKGETLGIIGENGAGKSTILKLIAGMLKPDRGEIVVLGRVSGLLELGAGFQIELTGRENIYLNASLFGLTQNQIEEKYEEIVNFANIGRFINAPVKCYSQGMFVRLAFAIAIHVNPDVLLIDDTLAVGDEHFQRKCIKKIFELKEQGKTIIFVTHDMNMLRRLCKRAIFLKEGRIIKDDSIDRVIPLYTQMVGERQGVGILENGPLNLVFNNGRLFINWQDRLLTPNRGAHTTFMISDKWYSSLQADWEVKKEDGNRLLATGKFYQLELSQIWRLEIDNDYEIKWDVEINSEEPLEVREGCTNIMLTHEYTNWFTTLEEGEFPSIDYKDKSWHSLLQGNISMGCVGVEEKETPNGKIPTLVFKQSNHTCTTSAQILNTDYLTNCRLLQYRALGLQNYLATPSTNHLLYFSGEIALDIPDIKRYLDNLEDEFILSSRKLRLTFDNGRCILDYNGIKLTKAGHISNSIYANGRWYVSNLAYWNVKKEGKNKLIATGMWTGLPIIQIWEIEIINEFSFLWKIDIQVDEEVEIEQQHIWFMASQDYKYWFSDYGEGKLPDNFLELNTDILQKCIPGGAVGFKAQNTQLPLLSLRFSKGLNNFAKIFNSASYDKARILQIGSVTPEQNTRFSPGQYSCLTIEAALDKDKHVYRNDSINILQNKRLKVVFDDGRVRIYCDGIELTKRLGLYTSLRSQGRWYDSTSSALWKIEEKDRNIIKASGKWLHLPLVQSWEITLKEDKIIEFNVNLKVDKSIDADRLQANLMLSERYSKWVTDKEQGLFPLFKEDVNDDWESIWSARDTRDNSKYIGVLREQVNKSLLPSVIFSSQASNPDWFLNIINSDIYHRGRVLQYLNTKKMKIPAGEHFYFSGNIIIED